MAAHRNTVPARGQRTGGYRPAQPHHPGLGRLLPDGGVHETFSALDHYLWKLTYKWAKHSHPNKPTRWIIRRYFGTFNKSRHDRWVFGDRASGAYLLRFSWTKIVRHQMVRGTSSPDDPALASYWADRRRKGPRQLDITSLRLLQAQHSRCPQCGDLLLDADRPPQSPRQWEQWLTVTRKAIIHNTIVLQAEANRTRLHSASCTLTATGPSPGSARASTAARQRAARTCLSRMHGNVPVRF
jgi:RNA-directed DNA polymerase